ncbi:hypothetical protein NM208_g16577 [Fusarium decemcellulare]|uniref:Uncharacterized protein n=1 Tax=Fusarium decemcellulare TaxID=57161 RepID=A0ACC1R9U1_9HYPO|nr:hypothetical protein NM208_g16577 [Fusarium decemcellulare]
MADNVLAAYWEMPAVARTLVTTTVVLSGTCLARILSLGLFIHHPFYLWQFPPQIWRLVTCFFLSDHPISLLMDSYFLYRYCVSMEMGNPRFPRKVDLVWYILFICGTILCFASTAITVPGNEEDHPCTSDRPIIRKSGLVCGAGMMIDYVLGLTSFMFLNGLILAMVYTVTQEQRGMKTQYFVLTIPSQMLPYCMILVALLMAPGKAVVEVEGLVAAHLFNFLTRIWPEFGDGPRLLRTPAWLESLVPTPRVAQRGYGTAVRPGNAPTGRTTGASTGPLPDSWKTRGPGHRLG